MIYTQEDFDKEKLLVINKIAKNAINRQYPAAYVENINLIVDKYYSIYNFQPNTSLFEHPKVKEAFNLAVQSHEGQLRKYTNEEYLVHLKEVATFISSIPRNTHEEVIAGLLHDVVEKGNISFDYIKENFGENIYQHIYYLSDIATLEDGNREARVIKNWNHFSQSNSKTKNIKAIDILSSARTTMLCDAKYGETYMNVIIDLMNPSLQKSDMDSDLKKVFSDMIDISIEIIALQKQHNIHKLEKTYSNKIKSLKKQSKLSF